MKTYPKLCAVCKRGSIAMFTGPVPPLSEIIQHGPARLKDMDFTVAVCSFDCADEYRRQHPLVEDVTRA